jgi:hypothetical protein
MNAPLTDTEFDSFGRLEACALANVVETFRERLRNAGFASKTLIDRCQSKEFSIKKLRAAVAGESP